MADNPELFLSAWLKWAWAVAHADTLERQIRVWRDNPERKGGIDLWKSYDPKRHRIDVFVAKVEPLPVEWGLVLGDVAHNLRSCLDHIAWALVTRGRTPPARLKGRQRNKIYFPIYDDRTDFNGSLSSKLPGVRRTDIAVVRRYQPYKHGKRKAPFHLFAILARVANDDKHRSVQPVPAVPIHTSYKITDTRDCEITRWSGDYLTQELKVGVKLAPIYVRKTGPHPDVAMEGQLAAYPTLDQGFGFRLEEWLTETPKLVGALLQELSDTPTELMTKLSFVY